MRDWQAELARSWASEHDDDWATLAVDGHVKVYAGRNGRLPKHFVARQKLCLPASVSYWINALGGAPLLCLHKALDPKLVKALEHDVVPHLGGTGRGAGSGPRPDRAGRRGASAHPRVRPRGLEPGPVPASGPARRRLHHLAQELQGRGLATGGFPHP